MKNTKKLLAFLMALAVIFSMCGVLAGCGDKTDDATEPNGTQPQDTTPAGETVAYSVSVQSAGGMPLEGVAVSVYTDEALTNMQGYSQTDEGGMASINLPEGGQYYISLSGVPKGYELQKHYSFNGTGASITLNSSLVKGENLAETTLKLGDVMYDFTVTAPDGTEITLSEMLQEKDMVLLNFWYTSCSWCVTEFPFMEKAYQMYQEDVGIIALDPLGESNEAIAAFPASQGLELSFPLAACPTAWANTFGIQGYPTSVIVDRYGVIVLIESGAIPSLRPFTSLFETLSGDDYEQKLYNSIGELTIIPEPTYEMADSETVAAILGASELPITFRPEEGDSATYTWPFIEAEKNGEKCLKASNQLIEDSYAIMYMDVTLKAGEALAFDFLRSTETNADIMYVLVDDLDINAISGFFTEERWETCYPLVAEQDGTYEVALCYLKDAETDVGDDTVYIKNLRIVEESDIDTATYLPKQAATTTDGFTYNYAEIVYNSKDGYYHVGSANGPLLLVDLMNTTEFSEENSIWMMAYNGDILIDGVDYGENIETYANYALNSNLYGVVSVNQELYELMQKVDQAVGFDDADDQEWFKACKYYQSYGTKQQLEDPIKGLAPFSAYEAKLGKNVPTNFFYYNRLIMPRGLYAEFVPSRSGVYRITSRNDSRDGVDGWIFDENKQILVNTDTFFERMFNEPGEISMVYYMEAGKSYYINIALKTTNEQMGYVYYDIEYLGSSYKQFLSASPGAFTYSTDESGTAMNYTIAPGIDVVLGDDGIYYHDLGDGKKGSKLYADFIYSTSSISTPISSGGNIKGLIELGAFDFSKDESDTYVLTALRYNDNDPEKTVQYLRTQWGADFEANYEMFKVEEVLNGIYHGKGQDYTDVMRQYEKKIISSGASELRGCVVVDEQLAEILQMLMDKYTFQGVETSWRKMCYYYEYL